MELNVFSRGLHNFKIIVISFDYISFQPKKIPSNVYYSYLFLQVRCQIYNGGKIHVLTVGHFMGHNDLVAVQCHL